MLQRIIHRLLLRRHFWRRADFSELSELYISMMLRSMGLSLIGIFVPIYLYKIGNDLPTIFLFLACLFGVRWIGNLISGLLVARIGPKHTMLLSYVTQICALALLLTLPVSGVPLWAIASIWGMSLSMFFIAYHVDFSKVMHADHGGKELGYMVLLERLGAAMGPVIGGVVASVFGPEWTIGLALILLAVAVVPLFLTAEPTQTHQRITFRGLPYGRLKRDAATFVSLGIDNQVSLTLWPLFIAVTLFTVNSYASVGLVTSIGVVAAIVAAKAIGQLIDRHRGVQLLRWTAVSGGVLHILRPFIGSFGGVITMNLAHDAIATGYRLALVKGFYSRADDLPGFRIAYIVYIETIGDIAKTVFWLLLFAVAQVMAATLVMQTAFIVGGIATMLLIVERFPGLRRPLMPVRVH